MASKSVTISPSGAAVAAQAAGLSASCVDYDYEQYANGWQRWYRLTAPAIPGWIFDHFEWKRQKYHNGSPSGVPDEFSESLNPYPPTSEGKSYPGAGDLADTSLDYGAAIGVDEYICESLFAIYAPSATYTITTTASPTEAGTTTGSGTYYGGAMATITASPNVGYRFLRWESGGATISTSASYSFTVTASAAYTAIFEYVGTATITIQATAFGLVHFAGDSSAPQQGPISKTVTSGTSVTIEASESYGSTFKRWQSTGGSPTYQQRIVTISVSANVTLVAYFAQTIEAHARIFANRAAACPNGQVRILVQNEPQTTWAKNATIEIYEAVEVKVEQRSTGGGWAFTQIRFIDTTIDKEYISVGQDWNNYFPSRYHGYKIYALFSRTATNLLVNSFNRSSPVRLLYDPATNKLVADY